MARMSPNFGFCPSPHASNICFTTGSMYSRTCEPTKMQGHRCAIVCFLMRPTRPEKSGPHSVSMSAHEVSPPSVYRMRAGSMTFLGHLGMSDIEYYKP
jgi:hypothetical protein